MLVWLAERYPTQKLLVGGQIMRLTSQNSRIAGLLGVAPQSGYWRLWPAWPLKVRMFLFWYGVIPVSTALFGYFPGSKLGLREDLPAGIVSEWTHAGRQPDYILDLFRNTERDHFALLRAHQGL
jgi:predicted alpha/beta hydrolase